VVGTRNAYIILVEYLRGGDNMGGLRLRVDRKIILKWTLKKESVKKWTGFNWIKIEFRIL
jgi:hypothetical protein